MERKTQPVRVKTSSKTQFFWDLETKCLGYKNLVKKKTSRSPGSRWELPGRAETTGKLERCSMKEKRMKQCGKLILVSA